MKLMHYDHRNASRLLDLLRSIAAEIQERTRALAHIEEEASRLAQNRAVHRREIEALKGEARMHELALHSVARELEHLNCTIEPTEPLTFLIPGSTDRPHHAYRWRAGAVELELAPVASGERAA